MHSRFLTGVFEQTHREEQIPNRRLLRTKMNRLSSLFERHRLLTSRRLRLNWPRCVPSSTQGNPMAAISTVGALVSSAEELQRVLAMHGYVARRETVKVL